MARKNELDLWVSGVRSGIHQPIGEADERYLLAVYDAIQSRLNDYRQHTLTIGLVVLGISTGLDAVLVQKKVGEINEMQTIFVIVAIAIASWFGAAILRRFQKTFEELSSVVEIIDDRFNAFTTGHYIELRMLHCFGRTRDLSGWQDPMIELMWRTVIGSGVLHVIGFTLFTIIWFGCLNK